MVMMRLRQLDEAIAIFSKLPPHSLPLPMRI
jgi:hypothetical protein